MSSAPPRHIALQFGRIKHFNEGLSEVSRQLGLAISTRAAELKAERGWHFHFILAEQWHGMFGDDVSYHTITDRMRWPHRFPVNLDVWHGLHQHMRYVPPVNCLRTIITVHDLNHVYGKRGLSRWWQGMRLGQHLRQADQLVAISRHVADDLSRHVPLAIPTKVIHNGVADLTQARWQPVADLPPGRFMLHLSRMSPSKNVEALIGMAAAWPEQLFVMAGPDSPDVTAHHQRVAMLGLRNVRIITDVSEAQKAWLYAHCQAFLFPSLMEGFGLPPVEAMFFGKPVIVARRTSLPEICGEGAAYWDNFEPLAMREVVEARVTALSSSSGLSATVQQQAQHYHWEEAASRYLGCYGAAKEESTAKSAFES